MVRTLTKKQKEILEYIRVFNELHGYAPSLVEIQEHFRLKAVSTVHEHIQNLKTKGYLQKEISQARSIRLIDPISNGKAMIEVPVLYALNNRGSLTTIKSDNNIYLHQLSLDKDSRYFAIRIDCDDYNSRNICQKDVILIKECSKPLEQGIFLATINKKSFFLGEIKFIKDKMVLEKIDSNKNSIDNFMIKGQLKMLLRNFSAR